MTTAPSDYAPRTNPAINDEIDAAVLAALEAANGELVPWRTIRPQLPGDWHSQGEALTRLFESRAVYVVKIAGRNYCRLEHGANAPGPERHPREFQVL
ncbi:hypothetical protein M1247_07135 [Mycobacterium sp. 21AC1]|uniref:hypothetical protein n=1 Tax=[Mycobacterium] appelbergii TaxID=2939269 RepID=UPI0029391DD8|nr:hypothetical protein [Mycobacterium sp. 21AC1]MDV3124682.1 hypothetical protein [Mycobacterium sp. 21AC1]